jgi:predicted cupin superfamily sugar epimerase
LTSPQPGLPDATASFLGSVGPGCPALPPGCTGPRSTRTAILYLLTPGQEAPWHMVRSTELWLYHFGGPLLDIVSGQASATTHLLGAEIAGGQQPQLAVPSGHWQRAQLHGDKPSLVSCIVVPGFDFDDFVLDAAASR